MGLHYFHELCMRPMRGARIPTTHWLRVQYMVICVGVTPNLEASTHQLPSVIDCTEPRVYVWRIEFHSWYLSMYTVNSDYQVYQPVKSALRIHQPSWHLNVLSGSWPLPSTRGCPTVASYIFLSGNWRTTGIRSWDQSLGTMNVMTNHDWQTVGWLLLSSCQHHD